METSTVRQAYYLYHPYSGRGMPSHMYVLVIILPNYLFYIKIVYCDLCGVPDCMFLYYIFVIKAGLLKSLFFHLQLLVVILITWTNKSTIRHDDHQNNIRAGVWRSVLPFWLASLPIFRLMLRMPFCTKQNSRQTFYLKNIWNCNANDFYLL